MHHPRFYLSHCHVTTGNECRGNHTSIQDFNDLYKRKLSFQFYSIEENILCQIIGHICFSMKPFSIFGFISELYLKPPFNYHQAKCYISLFFAIM
jgi:hypothetical protein